MRQTASFNGLMTTKAFWEGVPAESVLVFQVDARICSHSDLTFGQFLHYDYIGAPWGHRSDSIKVGNGGFSLRKRSVMLKVIQHKEEIWAAMVAADTPDKLAEDVFFSFGLTHLMSTGRANFTLATMQEAMLWAMDYAAWGMKWRDDVFAVHQLANEPTLTMEAQVLLRRRCPEALILRKHCGLCGPCDDIQ